MLLIALAVTTVVGLTLAALAGTGHLPGSRGSGSLKYPGEDDGSWTEARLPETRAGRSYSFGVPEGCLTGDAAEATVESVELVDPKGGITLRHFSVHEIDQDFEPGSLGSEARSLKALGWPVDGPQVVRTKCYGSTQTGAQEGTTGIPVEVTKPTDATAGASGVMVHWRIDKHRGELFIPFAIGLCEDDVDTCPHFYPEDN